MTTPNNITVPVAYVLEELCFCPACAYKASLVGLLLAGIDLTEIKTMEDVIAATALTQVERGLPIDTPMGTMTPPRPDCDNCGKALA